MSGAVGVVGVCGGSTLAAPAKTTVPHDADAAVHKHCTRVARETPPQTPTTPTLRGPKRNHKRNRSVTASRERRAWAEGMGQTLEEAGGIWNITVFRPADGQRCSLPRLTAMISPNSRSRSSATCSSGSKQRHERSRRSACAVHGQSAVATGTPSPPSFRRATTSPAQSVRQSATDAALMRQRLCSASWSGCGGSRRTLARSVPCTNRGTRDGQHLPRKPPRDRKPAASPVVPGARRPTRDEQATMIAALDQMLEDERQLRAHGHNPRASKPV
jgi:hypothetical protein